MNWFRRNKEAPVKANRLQLMESNVPDIRRIHWLVRFLLLVLSGVLAQIDQRTISGAVQDNTGAVIPNVKVLLTNTDLVLQTKTRRDRVYVLSPIKFGHPTISTRSPGFERTQQANLPLHVQQWPNVAPTVEPGSVHETVNVLTAPPRLPINGHNRSYVGQMVPGIITTRETRGGRVGNFSTNVLRA
jgi:Carboxypeptidase regulatory-like domain